MKNITKYLQKNFLASTSKTLITSLVTLLLLPLIIKKLGIELYGIISLTLLFSGVSSLIDLGLSKAIILLSGEKGVNENKIVSSALYINLFIISLLLIVFVGLQLLSVDLLGSNLNVDESNKFIILNIGFILLVLMLLNNLCRTILEAKYKMHIVNLTLAIYTPLLYLSIFIVSFFTNKIYVFVLLPLILTFLMFAFNVIYLKANTSIQIIKVTKSDIAFVLKKSFAFLNIGLINSMVMPLMRYLFVLLVADVALYGVFDLSFKIAMLANSFILSLAAPMFAVFSKEVKTNSKKMIQVAYKIFYISIAMYLAINVGYYFLGNFVLSFLDIEKTNLELLYNITFILILSLGTVAVVEIFYRFFLGNNQLKKAFLLKLMVPVFGVILFLILKDVNLVYRFIYAYGISLVFSAVFIALSFIISNKKAVAI